MPYVSDLFGCCCFAERDRPVSERKNQSPLPSQIFWPDSSECAPHQWDVSSLVMVHFRASEFKTGEVRRGMRGTDAHMRSCLTLVHRPVYYLTLSHMLQRFKR